MTTNLEKLTEALKRDTPEKRLATEIENRKTEIKEALDAGLEVVLQGPPQLIIKKAS